MLFLRLERTAPLRYDYVKKGIVGLNPIPIPFLSDIPFIEKILFNHEVY